MAVAMVVLLTFTLSPAQGILGTRSSDPPYCA